MNNYRDKGQKGFTPKSNRERASFNPNFNNENRLNQRPRFNKGGEGYQQSSRTNRWGDNDGGNTGRYGKQEYGARNFNRSRSYGEQSGYNRFDGGVKNDRQGGFRKNAYAGNSGYGSGNAASGENHAGYNSYRGGNNAGNYNSYKGGNASNYGNRGNRKGAYDPNAKYSEKKRKAYREAAIDPTAPVRLNKYLSNAGICSRREADNYIEAGLITVNGTVVTELGTKVSPADEVRFNNERVNPERKVYVLLNKPKDCVTTVDDPQERKTVLDCLKGIGKERIYPVGRLDRNTTGVLLLTNDGDMAAKLTHPKFMKKKIYHVTCDKNVAMSDMDLLVNGIELEDGHVYADEVSYVNDADRSQIGIEIHSGKNRIVRRMLEHLGYRVNKLDRVLFAGLTKKNLRRGDWRYLTDKEVNMLRMGAYE